MSHRMLFVALAFALAFGVSHVAGAAATTTISGSVVASTTPSFTAKPGRLVVRILRATNDEIGLYDQPLPANGPSYPFSIDVDSAKLSQPGPFTIKVYILDQGRYIYYYTQVDSATAPKTGLNITIVPVSNPGTQILPTGSAGTLLLLGGILSIILAGGVAVWRRRRRTHVLTQRFA